MYAQVLKCSTFSLQPAAHHFVDKMCEPRSCTFSSDFESLRMGSDRVRLMMVFHLSQDMFLFLGHRGSICRVLFGAFVVCVW